MLSYGANVITWDEIYIYINIYIYLLRARRPAFLGVFWYNIYYKAKVALVAQHKAQTHIIYLNNKKKRRD